MQKSSALILLVCLLPSCATEVAATPAPDDVVRNPWCGFAPGSWVVVGIRRIGSENPESLSTYRDEVVGTSPTGDPLLQSSWKPRASSPFQPSSSTLYGIPVKSITFGMIERSRRRETLELGGRKLNCSAVDYTLEESSPAREATLTLWKADGVVLPPWDMAAMSGRRALPADVVRVTLNDRQGKTTVAASLEVVEFESTIEVGGRKVACVVGKTSSIATYPSGSVVLRSWRTWLSPEVPGFIARRDRQCTDSPTARPHEYTIRDEVTAFHTVR